MFNKKRDITLPGKAAVVADISERLLMTHSGRRET
jgi:hypothetical protein